MNESTLITKWAEQQVFQPTSQEVRKTGETELLFDLERNFTIQGLDENITQEMKQNILHIVKTLPKEQQELFTNVKIICAEMKIEGKSRSDFKGLDFAVEELTKNEDKHIYIASFLPKNSLRQVSGKPEAKFLFNQPHIHFIQLPFSAQQFVDSVLQQLGTETVDNAEKTEAFAETIEKAVWSFRHDTRNLPDGVDRNLQHLFALTDKNEAILTFEDNLLGLLYLFRPHTKQSSRKENLGRIVSYYEIAKAKTTHEGERYEGVFVDFDNTLVDFETQEINHKVLELIEQYQKKGKEIIVRTLGDIAKKWAILDKAGLPFKVVSKADFKGATVEITIDDRSASDLYDNVRIKTEKHIQM